MKPHMLPALGALLLAGGLAGPAAAQPVPADSDEPPPRRLVLCLDGTWQSTYAVRRRADGDRVVKPTNVLKTCRSVLPWAPASGREQIVYYEAGVGAVSDFPGTSNRILHFADRTLGGAWGAGFEGKVEAATTFLVHNHRPGDELFVFGFSRGASEARAVTRFLDWLGGLPAKGDAYYLPIFYREYLASRGSRPAAEVRAEIDARHREADRLADFRPVDVVFLGVWDTVMSLGSRFKSRRRTSTASRSFHVGERPARCVRHARQALSIDETRSDFRPEIWRAAADGQTLEQRWFAGDHSNVGGGYADDGLANLAFHWLLTEAAEQGLEIDDDFAGHYRGFPFDRLYTQRGFVLRLLDKLRGTVGRGGRRLVGQPEAAHLTLDRSVVHRLRAAPGEFEEMGRRPYRPHNVLRYLACIDDLDAHLAALGLEPRHRELPADVLARLDELRAGCRPGDVPPTPAVAAAVLAGTWSHLHPITMYDGSVDEPFEVDDELVLTAADGGLGFELLIVADNAHTCQMEGVAAAVEGGFEYREHYAEPELFGSEPCVLRFEAADGGVVVEDVGNRCRVYWCGVRARIGRTTFER